MLFTRILNFFSVSSVDFIFYAVCFFCLAVVDILGLGMLATIVSENVFELNLGFLEFFRIDFDTTSYPSYITILVVLLARFLLYLTILRYLFDFCVRKQHVGYEKIFARLQVSDSNSFDRVQLLGLLNHHVVVIVNQGLLSMFRVMSDLVLIVVMMSVLLLLHPNGILVIALFIVVVGPCMFVLNRLMKPLSQKVGLSLAEIGGSFSDQVGSCDEGKQTLVGGYLKNRLDQAVRSYRRYFVGFNLLASSPKPTLELLVFSGLCIGLATEVIDPNGWVMLGAFGIRLVPVASQLSTNIGYLSYAKGSVDQLVEFLDAENTVGNDQYTKSDVNIACVGFSSVDGSIDLAFPDSLCHGEILGVSGASGSGKTTLVRHLCGLSQNPQVSLVEKGLNGSVLGPSSCFFLPQKPFIFKGTLIDNLTFGDAGREPDAISYLKLVGLSVDRINILKNDIITNETPKLSVGQIQRLGFVRALLSDCSVVIMDEPTSALAKEDFKFFEAALAKMRESRILIIVSHDSQVMKLCDVQLRIDRK